MQTYLFLSTDLSQVEPYVTNLKNSLSVSSFSMEEIFPAPSITIDTVRQIKQSFVLKPFDGKNRLLVIHDIQKATREAQQALLKILEEPPAHTYIVLTTNNSDLILPTIVSRSQIVHPSPNSAQKDPKKELLVDLLYEICRASPGQRILLAQKQTTTKDDSLLFLRQLELTLQSLLHDSTACSLPLSAIAQLLSKTAAATRFLQGNVNVKATMDVFFLGFPRLTNP